MAGGWCVRLDSSFKPPRSPAGASRCKAAPSEPMIRHEARDCRPITECSTGRTWKPAQNSTTRRLLLSCWLGRGLTCVLPFRRVFFSFQNLAWTSGEKIAETRVLGHLRPKVRKAIKI